MISWDTWNEFQDHGKAQNAAAENKDWRPHDPVPGCTQQVAEFIDYAPWLFGQQVENYRYQRETYAKHGV